MPDLPGEEPPAAAPFTVNITLSNGNEETSFSKPVTLTLCKFGLTELPVAVPPVVAVSFQFQDDDTSEYLDLSFGTVKIEQLSGANEELAQYSAALSGKKIKPGASAVAGFPFFLPANGKFKLTAEYGNRFDSEVFFSTSEGPQEVVAVKLRPKTSRAVGRATLELDVLTPAMLASAGASEKLLDVALVLDTTSTMGPAVKEVGKILGAGGALCELHKVLEEDLPLVKSLNAAVVIYKDHKDQILGAGPDAGFKQVFQMGNNWAGLAPEAQKLEASGGGTDPYDAAGAALHHVANARFGWRDNSVRVVLLVTDGPPHGPAGEGFEGMADDPFKAGGPMEDNLPTWPALCKTLASQSVSCSAALLESAATPDDYNNSATIALSELTHDSATGFFGRVKREHVGKLFAILAATVEVALDLQIIADTLVDEAGPYAALLAPLKGGATDADSALSALLAASDKAAKALVEAGFVVREAEIHPETDAVQVVRRPLTAVHVWEALKTAVVHGHFTPGDVEKKFLTDMPNNQIKALYKEFKKEQA